MVVTPVNSGQEKQTDIALNDNDYYL